MPTPLESLELEALHELEPAALSAIANVFGALAKHFNHASATHPAAAQLGASAPAASKQTAPGDA